MRHYPNEFGGILIGNYSEDMKTCYIMESIIPEDYDSRRYSFQRGKKGLLKKMEFYSISKGFIYVGEWHTHPDMPPRPSQTDKDALNYLANHDDVNISNPILLILSNTKENYTFECYIQFKDKLHSYEKED